MSTERRIKQINTENFIWVIYLFIIGLCFYANHFEKKYFYFHHDSDKEKYRKLTIFIFLVAVIIYLYYLLDNYHDYKNLNTDDDDVKKLGELSVIASGLIVVSGLIFLYIAIVDEELNIELAFN